MHTTLPSASLQLKQARYLRAHGASATCPPHRAADHIAQLRRADMTDAQIRTAARVGLATFYRAARQQGPITRTSERRILAVPVPARRAPVSLATVPPHGARRRLQALVYAGWPPPVIAAALGRRVQHVHELLHRDRDQVSIRVDAAVCALFSQWWDQRPEQHGVKHATANRARLLAVRHGFHPAMVWDDIDAADAAPQYGDEVSRQQAVVEDTAELVREGLSREGIATRLGIQWDAVRQAHRRAGIDAPTILD